MVVTSSQWIGNKKKKILGFNVIAKNLKFVWYRVIMYVNMYVLVFGILGCPKIVGQPSHTWTFGRNEIKREVRI